MRFSNVLSLGLISLSLTLASASEAEPLRLHTRLGAAVPLTGYQVRELGWGGGLVLGLELPFVPQLGVAAELGVLYLTDGQSPAHPGFIDQGEASAYSGAFALHFRPFASNDPELIHGLSGVWASASFGATQTGPLQRFMSDATIGYDLLIDDGTYALGPYGSLLHVFQPDSELRPADANILVIGVHLMFDGADKTPLDTDRDGIVDRLDRCPEQPEDKDSFEDEDGCPDLDNDADGILDPKDQCPVQAEDLDGFQDEDGCPEDDNDKDGIPDSKDKCPDEPEDEDGFEDDDGCPEPDNDLDGILDAADACPTEAEVVNGYADEDGCPDVEQIRVVGDKILLDDRVHFRTNSAIIREVSYPLLRRVAELIKEHPEYVHIEVQGHADGRGDEKFNMDLSTRRAESVMKFLVAEGLLVSRLSFKGFGSTIPLVENSDEHSWYLNRRVEFKITREVEAVVRSGGPEERAAAEAAAAKAKQQREKAAEDSATEAQREAAEAQAGAERDDPNAPIEEPKPEASEETPE